MSEFGSFPSSASTQSEHEPDAFDNELDDIERGDDIESESAELLDADDTFEELEAPEPEPEEEPTESQQEPEPEPRTLEELSTWEDLHKSPRLKQRVREVAFNRISQVNEARDKIDNTKAGAKWQMLDLKRQAQEWQYSRYIGKAKRARSEKRQAKFVIKANRINRRLSNTNVLLANHNRKFGKRDEDGKPVEGAKRKVDEIRDKQLLERRRELERKRALILERQIIAKEKKRRRKEKTEGLRINLSEKAHVRLSDLIVEANDKSLNAFRRGVRGILKDEIDSRVNDYGKTLDKKEQNKKAA